MPKGATQMLNKKSIVHEARNLIHVSTFVTFIAISRVEEDKVMRRFYMNLLHAGCENDTGWLVMVTKDTKCGWGKNCGDKPCFLYSKKKTAAVWSNTDGKYYTTQLKYIHIFS